MAGERWTLDEKAQKTKSASPLLVQVLDASV